MAWKVREEFKHVADPYAQQKFFKGGSKTSTSTSTETWDPEQAEYFQQLLTGASDWLSGGGLKGTGGSQLGNIEGALGAMGGYYGDVLSGDRDRAALEAAQQANVAGAQRNLEQNLLPTISESANMAGGAGGSRQGIAEGLAVSQANQDLMNQNAQMEYQFQQDAMKNQANAAGGMLNLAGGLQALQESQAANSDQAQMLQSLLAFKDLISGNMGGTSTATGSQTAPGGSSTGSILGGLGSLAGGIGTIMTSDKTLKKNIKKKGTAETGGKEVGLYEWEWNKKGEKKGLKGKSEGVLAQEVKKVNPEAVVKDSEGDLAVDYSKVSKKKKKRKGGK